MRSLTLSLLFFITFSVISYSQAVDTLSISKYLDSLNWVSQNLYKQQNFDKALEINTTAEKMALETFGPVSNKYSNCIELKGTIYVVKGAYPEAEKCYLEAKSIREALQGKHHPRYPASVNNLAVCYLKMGANEKAEPLFVESLEIQEKSAGKDNPSYAKSLNNLANLYRIMRQYEKAEPLYLQSKMILEKTGNQENQEYARCLNNLGELYDKISLFEKAEPLLLQAKTIRGATIGKDNAEYSTSLTSLAVLYGKLGNYEKAIPLCQEALTIREKKLGKESVRYITTLNTLAVLYTQMGNNDVAEQLYLEAKALQEKVRGKVNSENVVVLNNLANLYLDLRRFDKSELLYQEALAIWEKTPDKDLSNYATSLNNLAEFYAKMGQYEKASPFYSEAIAMEFKAVGKEHTNYPLMLLGKANVCEKLFQYDDAAALMLEISELEKAPLLKGISYLSENELALFREKYQSSGNRFSSYMLKRLDKGVDLGVLPAINYDHQLFQRGFLLTAAGRLNVLASLTPETKELTIRLKGYQRQLAAEYSKAIAERNNVNELEEKVNELEKYLSRLVAGYNDAIQQVKWQEVQAALKPTEAAIEFIHFKADFFNNLDSTVYAALILRPGASQPAFVPLFEEKQLDSLLFYVGKRSDIHIKKLYSATNKAVNKQQKSLYDLIWSPLEKNLAGVQSIYFSPSGLLYRLNLAAIPCGTDSVVANKYKLVELGSTRQLVVPEQAITTNKDAVLFGGIKYEMANSVADSTGIGVLGSISRGSLDFSQTDSTLRIGTWGTLPYSEKEIASIGNILKKSGLKPLVFEGSSATEEAFKSLGIGNKPSPRVLHIATHGFFYPDPKITQQKNQLGDPVFRTSDHPMIRSGLLLAGANQTWKTGKPLREGMEDGILTAYEISQMNLSNTELVVLSACETGLGDIQGNEGVYGLQRAFKIAGAKYLIMSLYKVPDRETAEFMAVFYKKWLKDKLPIPDAFWATQKELRKRFPNPYSWAGFVLLE